MVTTTSFYFLLFFCSIVGAIPSNITTSTYPSNVGSTPAFLQAPPITSSLSNENQYSSKVHDHLDFKSMVSNTPTPSTQSSTRKQLAVAKSKVITTASSILESSIEELVTEAKSKMTTSSNWPELSHITTDSIVSQISTDSISYAKEEPPTQSIMSDTTMQSSPTVRYSISTSAASEMTATTSGEPIYTVDTTQKSTAGIATTGTISSVEVSYSMSEYNTQASFSQETVSQESVSELSSDSIGDQVSSSTSTLRTVVSLYSNRKASSSISSLPKVVSSYSGANASSRSVSTITPTLHVHSTTATAKIPSSPIIKTSKSLITSIRTTITSDKSSQAEKLDTTVATVSSIKGGLSMSSTSIYTVQTTSRAQTKPSTIETAYSPDMTSKISTDKGKHTTTSTINSSIVPSGSSSSSMVSNVPHADTSRIITRTTIQGTAPASISTLNTKLSSVKKTATVSHGSNAYAASTTPLQTSAATKTWTTTEINTSFAWLPSSIEIQNTISDLTTQSFNPAQATSLPRFITGPSSVPPPPNSTLITIGFKSALNYAFLSSHPIASAQILNFLPLVLLYPFSPKNDAAAVKSFSIQGIPSSIENTDQQSLTSPTGLMDYTNVSTGISTNTTHQYMRTSKQQYDNPNFGSKQIIPMHFGNNAFFTSIVELYVPIDLVPLIREQILNPDSAMFYNPTLYLRDLARLIDPMIPITGIVDDQGNVLISGSPFSTLDSNSESGSGSTENLIQAMTHNEIGSLDNDASTTNSHWSIALTRRFIIYIVCFSVAVLVWLLLFMHILKRQKKEDDLETSFSVKPVSVQDNYVGKNGQASTEIAPISSEKRTEEESVEKLVVTSDNTLYSQTTGIEYMVDENGDFYYMPHNAAGREYTPDSMETLGAIYYKEEEDTISRHEVAEEVSNIDGIQVDEDGNIEIWSTALFSALDIPAKDYDSNEMLETSDPFTTSSHGNFSKVEWALTQNMHNRLDDVSLNLSSIDIDVDALDEDSVDDVNIGEFDELDEIMYKRLSHMIERK